MAQLASYKIRGITKRIALPRVEYKETPWPKEHNVFIAARATVNLEYPRRRNAWAFVAAAVRIMPCALASMVLSTPMPFHILQNMKLYSRLTSTSWTNVALLRCAMCLTEIVWCRYPYRGISTDSTNTYASQRDGEVRGMTIASASS
ncbi:hypothetical protein HD806DRAFT_80101 [Xylariaceae sp. AK1471]|nr:hypothetical protein HD806DRAFT_80101 [Xylariaceae sp. AK1471]